MLVRRVQKLVRERMADEPVILLEGPRAVGKSTLMRELARDADADVIDLDDPATRDAVATDPGTFMSGPAPVFVDEYQKAPALLDSIKYELNRDASPGRFALTGSTRHDSLPSAAQALTGRLHKMTIYPLSQGEIVGVEEHLLADLFEDASSVVSGGRASRTTREDYISRVVTGGFPMALARKTHSARNRWFDDYIRLTLERDVRELSNIRQADALPRLLQRLAGQTAQVLNIQRAGNDIQLEQRNAQNYTHLLEAVFLIQRLPAWGKTLSARATASPKVHVVDSGVAARLLRLTPEKLAARNPTALTELGHLIETFVVGEFLKQASWIDGIAGCGHWRTYDNDEVDLVIERDDGAIVAVEVKASGKVRDDLRPLKKLRDTIGDAFLAGVVMYLGERSYNVEDRLHVLSIDKLWAG